MNYHVVVCTLAGQYRYLDSYETWAAAKAQCIYYAHRGGTVYVTDNAALAVRFMASLTPNTHTEFNDAVVVARRSGSKVHRFAPRFNDCCPWCEYDGKPKRNCAATVATSEYKCLCPHCGEVSELDAWYVKYRGRDLVRNWFTEGGGG